MKRLLVFLITLMVIMGASTICYAAVVDNGQCGDMAFWSLDDKGTLRIFGEGTMYSYSDPYLSPGNEAPWSDYKKGQITSIAIEEGITNVGDYAFEKCLGVISISIPESVENIGDYAFLDCLSLQEVSIPGTVKTIGDGAFSVDRGSMTVDGETVYFHSTLEKLVFSEGIESIGQNAFRYCERLENVFVPASVTSLGSGAFTGCSSLLSIEVDEGNINYCSLDGVLYNKQKTELLTFPAGRRGDFFVPDGVESIGIAAFSKSALRTVVLPEGIKKIDFSAFRGSTVFCEIDNGEIGRIILPESIEAFTTNPFASETRVVYMGTTNSWRAKWDEEDLGTLSLLTCNGDYRQKGVWSFGDGVLTVSEFPSEGLPSCGAPWFVHFNDIEQVVIWEGVTHIGDYAFDGCYNLKRVQFPDGLESIGEGAFALCSSLNSVYIPDSVTSIGESAFAGCESLAYCHLPQSLTVVSKGLFTNCSLLKKMVIPEQVTEILTGAFDGSGLETITLPQSIQKIEEDAFWCPLKTIHYNKLGAKKRDLYEIEGVEERGDLLLDADVYGVDVWSAIDENDVIFEEILFDGVTYHSYDNETAKVYNSAGITDCHIYPSVYNQIEVTAVDAYAFGPATKRITLPATITTIEENAFVNASALEEVRFEGTREEWENITIGENNLPLSEASVIFLAEGLPMVEKDGVVYYLYSDHAEVYSYKNTLFGSVTIPDTVENLPITSIADRAFYKCDGITSLKLTDNIETIGEHAFLRCEKLRDVSLPIRLKRIEESVFRGCSNLESMDIPEGVLSIGECAFWGCTRLETVILPRSILIIDMNAFNGYYYNPVNIKIVEYAGSSDDWEKVSVAEGNEPLLAALVKKGDVPVTGILLNKTTLNLYVDETETLKATIIPVDATNKGVIWTSSDTNVAIVENGIVTAKAEGNATITVTTEDGGFEATCSVTVKTIRKVTTSSSVVSNIIMVTPENAIANDSIIAVCYKDNEVVCVKAYLYNNEKTVPFVINEEFDKVKVLVWENLCTLVPLSDGEEIEVTK